MGIGRFRGYCPGMLAGEGVAGKQLIGWCPSGVGEVHLPEGAV